MLDAFSDERFQHNDLARFGVPPHDEVDAQLRFSLIHRPAPYNLAPSMLLASGGMADSQWDNVMRNLARWLVRHLDNPRLVIWIAQRGGQLHNSWSRLIERELDRFASLEREGKTAELEEIRSQVPKAIPGPLMRTLWRLLLSGRVKSHRRDLFRWKSRLERDGLTATLRLELRELLAPQVVLRKPPPMRAVITIAACQGSAKQSAEGVGASGWPQWRRGRRSRSQRRPDASASDTPSSHSA